MEKKNTIFSEIKSNKAYKELKIIGLILLCSFLFLVAWANRTKFHPANVLIWIESKVASFGKGSGFPCEIDGNKIISENLKTIDGNIIALSDTACTILNGSAKEVHKEKHNFSKPCLKVNGLRAMIYDIGSKEYKIESCPKNLYSGTTSEDIIACGISETGIYGIITESQSYLAEMNIYDRSHNEKYKYYFAEYYITDMTVNNSGTAAAVCGIAAEEGSIKSMLYVLDFKSEKPKATFEFSDNMLTDVKYFSNGNILIIGDKSLSIINPRSNSKQDFLYENKILKCYDFSKESGIACCFSSSVYESGDNEIVLINSNGKTISNFKTTEKTNCISFRNNKILIFSKNQLTTFNPSGKIESQKETSSNIEKLMLLPRSYAYTINGNKIDKLKL